MTWTDPVTWEDQELVTAELLNAQLSGNLDFLHDDFPPKRAMLWHASSLVTGGNALARSANNSQLFNCLCRQDPAANGDEFTQSFFLRAGTYTFKVLGYETMTSGKVDWYLDGTVFATGQDWANGSTYNVIKSVSDVQVTEGGVHVLKGKVNGKLGSSTDYFLYLTAMWFEPAAD